MATKKKPYVLAVVGSPRKGGNSDLMCDQVIAGARRAGATVEKLYLSDMNIHFCKGCEACQGVGNGQCVTDDDLRRVYPLLRKAEVLILASPIYFFTVSAQMKLFMDRLMPLVIGEKSLLGAKRAVVCMTYAAEDVLQSGCMNAVRTFTDMFAFLKIPATYLHASAWHKGAIRKNRAILRKAFEMGKEAVRGGAKCQ